MSGLTNTPWRVVEDEKWPWCIHVSGADGSVLWTESRYAYGTDQKTLQDVYEARGFPFDKREEVSSAVKDQIVRIMMTVDAVNTDATRDATIERLRTALAPFGAVAEKDVGDSEHDDDIFRPMTRYNRAPVIKIGDLRRARAALDAKP